MKKKYELTDETIEVGFNTLHRIRALRDFGNVKKGDLGGFVEDEDNLSHEGDCWIYENAKVYDDAEVFGGAKVSDNAKVFGEAKVSGNAKVYGFAEVYGHAMVYDNAEVYGDAEVFGGAKVFGDARVYNDADVYGFAKVSGDAKVYDNAWVYDTAEIYGKAHVFGGACVLESAKVFDTARVYGAVKAYGEAYIFGNADVCGHEEYGSKHRVFIRSQNANEAHKNDDGKPRVELIPPLALMEIGRVLEFGAKKYGANNWRNGMDWSRFHGAALRHLLAWFGGEQKDAESDLSHLAHAACCLLFLMECEAKQIGQDDRLHKN